MLLWFCSTGVVFGNGQVVTFDNQQYTLNGRGEYDLVTSTDKELSVQVRAEQVKLKSGRFLRRVKAVSLTQCLNLFHMFLDSIGFHNSGCLRL